MRVFPAIDILDGDAVRLRQGRRADKTVYGKPLDMALRFRDAGARALHVVDLGAAFSGASDCLTLIRDIVRQTGLFVELGGGIRTMADIASRLELGVSRVIVGTAAVEHPALLTEACARYPGQIAVGIDALNGVVKTRGWVSGEGTDACALAQDMRARGVDTVIYTDISRDGMLEGPNVAATRALIEKTGLSVIGSGGVGSLMDVQALRDAGCAGVIMGQALYSGAFALSDALSLED